MFTAVSDTPWLFLADLVRYQHDFSITRENNRDLSITGGHQHVVEEFCGLGGQLARPHGRYHHGSDHRMHD